METARSGGTAPTFVKAAFAPRSGRDGDALTLGMFRVLRVSRLLGQALRYWPEGVGALPFRAASCLMDARRLALASGVSELPPLLAAVDSARASLEVAVVALAAVCSRLSRERRAFRREAWFRFVQSDMAAGGRRTLRWVRCPASQAPPSLGGHPAWPAWWAGCAGGGGFHCLASSLESA